MIALILTLDAHAEQLDVFLAPIEENARRSFTDEPGCRYFDVTEDAARPAHFRFFEVSEDEAALEAHRAAPHSAAWREAAERCVLKRSQLNTVCRRLVHFA